VSLDPILWALKDAPVADSLERLVLVTLGERAARADGCTAFPSRDTLASTVIADPKTVQRVLQRLVKRKLIAKGDQSAARYIRADRRPVVYDLLIPYSWFPNAERMNEERRQAGLPPLTPKDRPDIAPPDERKRRSDLGKPRAKKTAESPGDCESPRESGHGGTDSPERGYSESPTGGLTDPRTSPVIHHQNHPVLPSAVDAHAPENAATHTDGGTDGSGDIGDQEQKPAQAAGRGTDAPTPNRPVIVTPGVQLLLAIGAEQPAFLLSGQTLADQGLAVTGMLASGWLPEHLRQVIVGRPLPVPVRTTVGAVVASRLRAAMAGPAPSGVPGLPAQQVPFGDGVTGPGDVTPVPPSWEQRQAGLEAAAAGRGVLRDCEGDGGLCPRLAVAGESQCGEHLGWGLCLGCGTRRVRPGAAACDHCEDGSAVAAPGDAELAALLAEASRRAGEAERAAWL